MSTYQSCRDKYIRHDHCSFFQTQCMQGHVFTEIKYHNWTGSKANEEV